MLPHNNFLTLVETQSYLEAKTNCGWALVEELEEGYSIALATDPEFFDKVPSTKDLYILRTRDFGPRIPAFRILFRYIPLDNPNIVELISISSINGAESGDE